MEGEKEDRQRETWCCLKVRGRRGVMRFTRVSFRVRSTGITIMKSERGGWNE